MENQNTTELPETGNFSTQTALFSFGIGTLILVTHLLFPKANRIIYCGLVYVVLAAIINILVLLVLLYHFIVTPNYREYFAIKILILLANIPIAVLYFFIVIKH